jgi:hypothetical protein
VVAGGPPAVGGDAASLPGSGTADDPYRIATAAELQAMADDLAANYTLVADVDASGTATWNGGAGVAPIGSRAEPFTGTFDGAGFTVSGLTIDRGSAFEIGLFGVVGPGGTVRNVGLAGATAEVSSAVGGLVGRNSGTVASAAASGVVKASSRAGGLVGLNTGAVSRSYATGLVTGTGNGPVGELVGTEDSGTVAESYWDVETTGLSASAGGGTGLATAELTGAAARETMQGFDVPGTWHLTESYPEPAWADAGPFRAVDVTGTTSPVEAGDSLEITATVANYGGERARQTVTLTDTGFTGSSQDAVAVDLDVGDAESVTLSWATGRGDVGAGTVTVASANDSDAVVVEVTGTGPPVDPEPPFDGPIPGAGGQGPPGDLDGDGRYEDVDGGGRFGFLDVIELLFRL